MNNLLIIIVCIIIVYVSTCNNKEHFVETQPPTIPDDIMRNTIYEVYQADVRGIQNLAGLCSQLLSNGLTIPGNVTATGQLNIYNSNTNNLLSFNKYQNPRDIKSIINQKWEVWHTSNPSVLTNNNQPETYDLVFTSQSLYHCSQNFLFLTNLQTGLICLLKIYFFGLAEGSLEHPE